MAADHEAPLALGDLGRPATAAGVLVAGHRARRRRSVPRGHGRGSSELQAAGACCRKPKAPCGPVPGSGRMVLTTL
jgi:hypothetical protein